MPVIVGLVGPGVCEKVWLLKIQANGLVYPGIDLNSESDTSLGRKLEIGLVTFWLQRYSFVLGSNQVMRTYLERLCD